MRIDAHLHLWDPRAVLHPWLSEAPAPLRRAHLPEDVDGQLEAAEVEGVVLVEAIDDLAGTEQLLAFARRWPRAVGVVGWAPVTRPDELEAVLDGPHAHLLVGLRHPVHTDPDPTWLARPRVVDGLRRLATTGRSFDIVAAGPDHLRQTLELARALPGLRLVVDHLGTPPVADGGWEPWAGLVTALADHPNVAIKISGLTTMAPGGLRTPDRLQPTVDHVLTSFGPARCLAGSDWPVSTVATSYRETMTLLDRLLLPLTDDERARVLGGTATEVYRLTGSARVEVDR